MLVYSRTYTKNKALMFSPHTNCQYDNLKHVKLLKMDNILKSQNEILKKLVFKMLNFTCAMGHPYEWYL